MKLKDSLTKLNTIVDFSITTTSNSSISKFN